jgi:hypothetical protein
MTPEVRVVVDQIKAVLREANNIRAVPRQVPRVVSSWDDEERAPQYHTEKSDEDISRANTLILSALAKFSPPRLPYIAQTQKIVDHAGLSNDYTREHLVGILKALLFEYENGTLKGIEELVHADLFSDFLAMARHLLDKGFKDPAAVMAAGVFEQHLHQLARKFDVPTTQSDKHRNAQAINENLAKAGAYQGDMQKEVTAKLAFRNYAAHGEWTKYEPSQVALFIDWVSFFMQRFPA